MYTASSRGSLMPYVWRASGAATPDFVWSAYWPGILDAHVVRGSVLLCPSAPELSSLSTVAARGFGAAEVSWSGRPTSNGTPIRFSNTTYRDGSYGMNRYLTLTGGTSGFGPDGKATKITGVRNLSEVPLFMDCMWVDTRPQNWNGPVGTPAEPPPDLTGGQAYPGAGDRTDQPEHWLFLLARHGRGINVCMADGSARWVHLEDTYRLRWREDWVGYSIPLPRR
jgi:prepilin-type processing-associated H-X9-DG protein